MWAPGTSLSEILPDAAAGDRALGCRGQRRSARSALMRDPERTRAANIAAVREAAAELTWDAQRGALIELYHATCDDPAAPASAFERRHGEMKDGISDDAMRLVGPDGALPAEMERPLLALATHPQIGPPRVRRGQARLPASYRLRRRRSAARRR